MRLALGSCGSGKTFHLMRLVALALRDPAWSSARFVVLDVAGAGHGRGQWPGEPARGTPRIRAVVVRSVDQVRDALDAGERYVIVRPALDMRSPDPAPPWHQLAGDLAHVACELRRVVLVLPEAHTSCREGYPLPYAIGEMCHAHRHHQVDLWADTQQPQYVKKELLVACETVYWFASTYRDHRTCRDLFGPEAAAGAARASAERLAGGPGWHVEIPTSHCAAAVVRDPRGIAR